MDSQILRNSFATECFRNIADQDYIAARVSYRMGLMNHFMWSSLQAVEKYLKAILLYNNGSAKKLGHDIEKLFQRVGAIPELGMRLEPAQLALVERLSRFGSNRYLEREAYAIGDELQVLDSLIWSVRRYCEPLNVSLKIGNVSRNLLEANLRMKTDPFYISHPYKLRLTGGYLESVLKKHSRDLLRQGLVWQNGFFSKRKPRKVMCRGFSVVPPHFRDQKYYACLSDVVDFPTDVKQLMVKE